MAKHPYVLQPGTARWAKSVAGVSYPDLDPVVGFPFRITPSQKVATAGSCFAQHIARHLKNNGFNYYVVEEGHPLTHSVSGILDDFNYGTFSARYGNLYTARQLLQLFKRAFGTFTPAEAPWPTNDGHLLDPFRPTIQPSGFSSEAELLADQAQHLAAVRHMFETLDVFVFTLGLTENWFCKADGAALPVCPGVSGGVFDSERYGFENLTTTQIIADMTEFLSLLAGVNSQAKVVLTVSPVPLAATMTDVHVLAATTYSKSVLRVVCEELSRAHDHVAYFPSYEIITGSYNRGRYFAKDLRSVTEEGVSHVMRLFLKHAADTTAQAAPPAPAAQDEFLARMGHVVKTTCDEELIEASLK